MAPKKEWIEQGNSIIESIKSNNPQYKIISLHLRRGDNTDGSNPSAELNNVYGENNCLDINSFYGQYLLSAKNCFTSEKTKFLVFSGGSRASGNNNESDIEWCERNLLGEEYIFAEPRSALVDFASIMACDGNIISHISSFGWWASYRRGFYPNTWRIV